MCPDTAGMTWLVPWRPIAGGHPNDSTAKELYSELCQRHVLFGVKARPVAHRQDCDDVLFELLDDSGRFAVVHLTYAQHPETDSRWPETVIYADWAEFVQTMKADAADWNP
jgi:hypothetical protein